MSETLDEIEILHVLEVMDLYNSEIEEKLIGDFEEDDSDADPNYDPYPYYSGRNNSTLNTEKVY